MYVIWRHCNLHSFLCKLRCLHTVYVHAESRRMYRKNKYSFPRGRGEVIISWDSLLRSSLIRGTCPLCRRIIICCAICGIFHRSARQSSFRGVQKNPTSFHAPVSSCCNAVQNVQVESYFFGPPPAPWKAKCPHIVYRAREALNSAARHAIQNQSLTTAEG